MTKQQRIKLSTNDRQRMTRLFEEVSGHLEEMSLIVGRNLRLALDSSKVVKFSPLTPPATKRGRAPAVIRLKGATIVCTPTGCGCYDNDTGICFRC